ncbi:hypothetical protein I203_107513 [Kwoniella mangroviensis CBS 8507]|uniref:hypothetical protein n=1 Tax=Kwoniella mangroviensis CBS 8507 TaxID=1296122 RepID=UPI00080CD960|nr:uncharacterized protein I203_02265 [Kwoniella mangroviensis CBS 8507]OCF68873.1 hypothetical protein I203_02265 [Kwoniella mangroviensis CBS 8507]
MSQGENVSTPSSISRSRMGSAVKPRSFTRVTSNGSISEPGQGNRPSIKNSPSESSRRKPTFTTSLNYPEVLPAPTYFANEGELQRSQRKSKVTALTKLDRAGTPIQLNSGPTATSFLPSSAQTQQQPQPVAGPSAQRNPLHRPVVVNPPFNPSSVRQEAPRHPAPRTTPRLFEIDECPTYYPTEEQFTDCMGYIASIADDARPYGICKIVPPEGWKMPFVLDSETFRFRTRLQKLNKLEAASRAKINFLEQLSMFHNQSNNKEEITIPTIERQPLDVWKLRKEVNRSGGYLELDRTKTWSKVTDSLGLKSTWIPQVREAYMNIVLPFDNYSVRAKSASVSPLTPLNGNTNGNVKPPAFSTDAPPSPSQPRSVGRMGSIKTSPRTRTSSRMSGASLGVDAQSLPLTAAPLSDVNGLQAAAEIGRPSSATPSLITFTIKVPGFSNRDGSESELSDAETSSDGSPKKGKDGTPEYKKGDICEICRYGHTAEKILLCDGCDRGFHTYCLDPPLSSVPANEEWFCTSCLLSQGDDFGFGEGEDHSVASFQARDASFSWHWWNRHRPVPSSTSSSPSRTNSASHVSPQTPIKPANPLARNFGKVTVTEDDVEREFWRLTESQTDTVEVEYGADVHSTTHGSAGPTMETHPLDPYAADGWNLNNMPILPDSLLRYIRSDISGMTVPWIYLGMMFSTFCWHNEDHYTYSVNYMYWGETKTWYGVPGSDAEKFEQAMKSEAPELFEQQPGLLFQLVTMMNPGRVKEAGVKVVACDQRPNEFVITFPKAYHCGFNHGINMNEAVNFALPDWLPDGREAVMRYQQHLKPPVFSHNELLVTITLYSETIRTALWLKDNLSVMVEDETRRRDQLRLTFPSLAETQTEEDGSEEQYQCSVCKSFCYLAQITCTCTKLVACLDHADQLCSCPKSKKTLRKRYTEAQLEEILAVVAARAAQPDAWRARLYNLLETPRPALKSMRALVADGEKIAYPMPEVQSLRALVDRANSWVERVSLIVTRKSAGRRRKGKKEEDDDEETNIDRSPENLSALLHEGEKLAFDAPEILQLRQALLNIQNFQSEATVILSTAENALDLEKCKTAQILGESLNLDLPEITAIANIVNRLSWFRKVEEEVDDRTLEYDDTVKLLDQAEEYGIPEDHPTIAELKKRRQRGADWLNAVDRLFNAPSIKIEEISELIEGKELIPVSTDKMRQLESIRKTVLNWQASAKNFLSSNGSALAASRLCKNVSIASAPINRVEIPEIIELQAELEHHNQWQWEIATVLEVPIAKVASTMNYLKREFETHLSPEDDEPNDEFVCFCRGMSGAVMVTCQNCLGEYHPKCVGISPKYANNPYQCEMCQRLLPGLSPSLNDFGSVVVSERWNFKIVPPEFKVAKEIVEIALRYSTVILKIIDPLDETCQPYSKDTEKIQHTIRKIYNLPLLLDATNIHTGERVVYIKWLFRRLQDCIKYHNGSSSTSIGNGNGTNGLNGTAGREKRTRGRKPKLIITQSYPREFHCICGQPESTYDNERFGATIECAKCNQSYHSNCVKAPPELLAQIHKTTDEENGTGGNKTFWRCPCCTVKEAKYYLKGVEVRVQFKEQVGTDQYIDYRSTINEYAEKPIMVNLRHPTDVVLLECSKFIAPILPEDFVRDDIDEGGEGSSRKRRKVRPSDIHPTTTTTAVGDDHVHTPSGSTQRMFNGNGSGPQTAYPSPITHPLPQPQTARMTDPVPTPQYLGPRSNGDGNAHSNGNSPTPAIAEPSPPVPQVYPPQAATRSPPSMVILKPAPLVKTTSPVNSDKSISPRQPPPHVLPAAEEPTVSTTEDGLHDPPPQSLTEQSEVPGTQNIPEVPPLRINIFNRNVPQGQSQPTINDQDQPLQESGTGRPRLSSGSISPQKRKILLEAENIIDLSGDDNEDVNEDGDVPQPLPAQSPRERERSRSGSGSGGLPLGHAMRRSSSRESQSQGGLQLNRVRSNSRSTQGSSVHDAIVVDDD